MASKHFQDLLKRMDEIHIKKSTDYANDVNPFQNFERAAILVSWFTNPVDQVFAGIIGIKLARLGELERSKKTPNNESLDDTYLDISNYCVLWGAYKLFLRDINNKLTEVIIEKWPCEYCTFICNSLSQLEEHLEVFHQRIRIK